MMPRPWRGLLGRARGEGVSGVGPRFPLVLVRGAAPWAEGAAALPALGRCREVVSISLPPEALKPVSVRW